MKRILAIILTLVLTISVSAASSSKTIKIDTPGIQIYVDGAKITPKDGAGKTVEPFVYNGNVYLPVQALGSAVGKTATYDAKKKTVTFAAPKKDEGKSYSRTNPAPVGTLQTIKIKNYSEEYTAALKVNSVVRGSSAWDAIKAANMFNSEPKDGKEYILAKISLTVSGVKGDKAISAGSHMFDCFSGDNKQYDTILVVPPEPVFQGDIYNNSSVTGYVVFSVSTSDAFPKIVFGRSYDGTGGVWFSLKG